MASRFLEGCYSEVSICESGLSGCFLFFLDLMTLKKKEMKTEQLRCGWFFLPALTLSPSHWLHPLLSSSCKALTLTSRLQWIPVLWFTPQPWLRSWNEIVTHTQHEYMWTGQERGRSRCTQCKELRGKVLTGKTGGRRVWGCEGKAGKFEGLRTGET